MGVRDVGEQLRRRASAADGREVGPVEATDTVSAKGKAKEADLIMTSAEIGRALGDLGVPMKIISDFTSAREIDAALRQSYDI